MRGKKSRRSFIGVTIIFILKTFIGVDENICDWKKISHFVVFVEIVSSAYCLVVPI